MAWTKKPRRSPKQLVAEHLDEVRTPDDYQQAVSTRALVERGYPWDRIAGRLEVREWSPGNLICTYVAWNGGIATRSFYSGAWRPWYDATGKEIV